MECASGIWASFIIFTLCVPNTATNKLTGGGGPPMQPYPQQPYPPAAAPYVATGVPQGSVYMCKPYAESSL